MSRIRGQEWACVNKKCEKYNKIQVRIFDALSDSICDKCDQYLKKYKRFKLQDEKAKKELCQFQ